MTNKLMLDLIQKEVKRLGLNWKVVAHYNPHYVWINGKVELVSSILPSLAHTPNSTAPDTPLPNTRR